MSVRDELARLTALFEAPEAEAEDIADLAVSFMSVALACLTELLDVAEARVHDESLLTDDNFKYRLGLADMQRRVRAVISRHLRTQEDDR